MMGTHRRRGLPNKRTILRSRSLLEAETLHLPDRHGPGYGDFLLAGWIGSIPLGLLMISLKIYFLPVRSDELDLILSMLRFVLPFLLAAGLYAGFRQWRRASEQKILSSARRILFEEGKLASFLHEAGEKDTDNLFRQIIHAEPSRDGLPRIALRTLKKVVDQTRVAIYREVPGSRFWGMLGGSINRQLWKVLGEQLAIAAAFDYEAEQAQLWKRPSNAYGIGRVELATDYLRNCDSVWAPLRCRMDEVAAGRTTAGDAHGA